MQKIFSVVALALLATGCASLKSAFRNPLPPKDVRVLELATIHLTRGVSFRNRGSFTYGKRNIRKSAPWQWRDSNAMGAPPQSFITPLFLGGDDLLVPTLGGGLSLIDIKSGKVRWEIEVPIGVASQPYVSDNSVIFAGMDANVRKVKLSNGQVEWTSPVSAESLGGVAVAQGFVFVTTGDDALWALDEKTGRSLWTYKRPSPDGSVFWSLRGNSIPALSQDGARIFAGFSDGTFVCLETSSGQTVWERRFERTGRFKDADISPVLSHDGTTIYVGVVDGDLLALKTLDGTTRWSVPGASWSSPNVDDAAGSLYLSASDSTIQKINLKDASVAWSTALGERGTASMPVLIGKKHLAVTTTHGSILVMDRERGTILWEKKLGYGSLAAPAFDGRRMLVLSARNYLLVHRVDEIESKKN